jgi:hypothetical protein
VTHPDLPVRYALDMASGDPFYTPGLVIPRCVPRPGELIWEARHEHVTWTCELRYHGEYGVEAQILRAGELVTGWRWPTRALAVRWAEAERVDLEAGPRA